MDWLTENKIPIGKWFADLMDFVNEYFYWFFDAIADVLSFLIEGLTDLLLLVPAPALIGLFALGAWLLHRSWKLTLGMVLSLLLVVNLDLWQETIQTLTLVVFSTIVCMAAGVPIGIAAAHRPWLFTIIRPILDLMQTIPTFVYLIPALILFGLGVVPGLVATAIFAIAAPIRLTHLGVTSVPVPLLEAGEAFGASKSQLLFKVELPHALPTIMAGLTQCIMLSLSMVVIAALVGADGLGKPVVRALNTVNIAKGFEAGLAIVIMAILLDRTCRWPERRSGSGGDT